MQVCCPPPQLAAAWGAHSPLLPPSSIPATACWSKTGFSRRPMSNTGAAASKRGKLLVCALSPPERPQLNTPSAAVSHMVYMSQLASSTVAMQPWVPCGICFTKQIWRQSRRISCCTFAGLQGTCPLTPAVLSHCRTLLKPWSVLRGCLQVYW